MNELLVNEMSTEEILELLNDLNDNSLINTGETDEVINFENAPTEVIKEFIEQKTQEERLESLRAENPLEYFQNSSKLGMGDSIAVAQTLIDAQKAPFKHLFKHLYFGSDENQKVQIQKETDMRAKLENFKNSEEYDALLANGQTDEIDDTIKQIQLEGGTRGLYWGEMLDSIALPPIPFTKNATYYDDLMSSLKRNEGAMAQITGADPEMQPSGQMDSTNEEAFARAIRYLSDPSFYIGGGVAKTVTKAGGDLIPVIGDDALLPLIKAGTKKLSSRFFRNGTLAGSMGALTVYGAEGGRLAEKNLFNTDTGAGELIGSFGGGFLPLASRSGLSIISDKLTEFFKNRSFAKKYPDDVAKQYAANGAKGIFAQMRNEITPETMDVIVQEFRKVAHMIGKEDIPFLVMAADSPTAQAELKRLMQTNPGFRNQVEEQVYNLGLSLDAHADAIFGTRYKPVDLTELPANLRAQGNKLINARFELDQKIEALDLSMIPQNADDIGKQISNLVVKREGVVREEMKPVYTSIDKKAKSNEVYMPGSATTDLYNYITENQLQDLFGKRSPIDNMITAYLKPKPLNETVQIIDMSSGSTVFKDVKMSDLPPTHPQYVAESMEISWAQMDSLKKAINRFGREDLSRTERRKLNQFKAFFKEQRKEMMDGGGAVNDVAMELNAALDAADVLYYEKIGIPYSQEGIVAINSKKYATEIAPVLFKNSESLNQFLSVAGEEGVEIAQNAYILRMYDQVMKDGVFNPKKVQVLMRKDREILESLPGIKQLLNDSVADQSKLMLKRDSINNAAKDFEKEIADHFLISSALSPNYPDLAKRLAKGDLSFYNKIQKDLSKLDTGSARIVNDNIAREYVKQVFETGIKEKNGAMKFMLNPSNEKMLNTIFDKDQINVFKNLSKLSDNLNKIDIGSLNAKAVAESVDPIQKVLPGVTTQYFAAQVRDRVSSIGMKTIRVVTHINQSKLQSKLDQSVQELLLHPDIKKLNVWGKQHQWKLTSKSFDSFKNIVGELIPIYIHGAVETPILNAYQEENRQRIKEGEK